MTRLLIVLLAGLMLTSCGGHQDDWDAAGVGAPGSPDFTIRITPPSQETTVDETITFTVTLTSVNGYSSPVQLSGSGLYGVSTYTFDQPTLTPTAQGATTTVHVYVDNNSQVQNYTLTVTGTGPSTTHSATATVIVGGYG